jgi:hypothetical protein
MYFCFTIVFQVYSFHRYVFFEADQEWIEVMLSVPVTCLVPPFFKKKKKKSEFSITIATT